MDTGELIRRTRGERGLDQAALARRAGTTQAYVSRVERGLVSPSLPTLERLLHAMGRHLQGRVAPLPPGNVSPEQLRADLRELSAADRLAQAIELSEYLTELAAEPR